MGRQPLVSRTVEIGWDGRTGSCKRSHSGAEEVVLGGGDTTVAL